MFSLSSHEPFETHIPTVIEGNSAEHLFLNSAYYTDKSLGDFIQAARQTDWWNNTLIIITADHGSRHPGNTPNYVPEKFHIPMLWIGGAIAKKDTVIATVASQTDIPPTILHQIGLKNDGYRFSKDILGTHVYSFAFYDFNDGFGFVDDNSRIAFDNVNRTVIYYEGTNVEKLTEKGKAYLQVFSNDFKMRDQSAINTHSSETQTSKPETQNPNDEPPPLQSQTSVETYFKSQNLVNIQDIDSDILVDLKYATTDNFTGMALYEGFNGAYFQPDVAGMLAESHRYLKTLHTGLRLLVYDAARPLSVQRKMWEQVKDTPYHRYVAHPDRLSLHNFGAAVDITIADTTGQPLDMGTPFDYFGRAAGISNEPELMTLGILNRQQIQNRQLLRQVMQHAGFRSISGEWWHFNACSLQEAKQRYTLLKDIQPE
jgi:D-alanyl-D-alanine dipeptidase